jgi:1,2-diacylglycerol 3-beta-galactosyltransferase
VVGLGFVTNMAEYMVATDILISKAGPGTISEAAALSLPVMLTSYLPGQEEGNVDYVIDGNFGAYCDDSDPSTVAEEIADWLSDEEKLKKMSVAAKNTGAPHAARDIVRQIGDSTLKWRELNEATEERRHLPTPS